MGCVQALQRLSLRYPEDVSIVGFDDFAWNETFQPPITTVAQPTREIGRESMQLLLDKIAGLRAGRHVPERQIVLAPELRLRSSTALLRRERSSRPKADAAGRLK